MEDNTVIVLNDIIFKIHTVKGIENMRCTLIHSLRFLIPCSVVSMYDASPLEKYKITNPIQVGISKSCIDAYLREYQDYDRTTWPYSSHTSKAYDDSSFIQDEARRGTEFYRKVYAPHQVMYQVTLTLIHDGVFLGILVLARTKKEGPFKQQEMFLLEQLAVHLAYRLFQSCHLPGLVSQKLLDIHLLLAQYHLTPREIEVLTGLLEEVKSEELCNKLNISQNTFKKHVMNIYKKLGVNNRHALYQKILEI